MAQQDESTAGRSIPTEWHDAQDVDLELARTGGSSAADQESDAAAAFKDAAKEAAGGKAAGWFEWSPKDLVDTPGGLATLGQIWIFFLQKLSLQKYVDVRWPAFYIKFLDVLGLLSFKLPAIGVIPEECVFTARLLLSVALLVRMAYVMFTIEQNKELGNKEAPRYDSAAGIVRTVVLGVAAPTLLSALAIVIGASTGMKWLTGLGVVLYWPVIGYLVLAHVVRIQIWKSCCSKCVHQVIISHILAHSRKEVLE